MKRRQKGIESLKRRYGRMFVLHWEFGLIVFFLIPIITSFIYSLSEVSIEAGGVDVKYIGFQFYKSLIKEDAHYLNNLRDAFISLLYSLPLTVAMSLIFACVLNQNFKGRMFARAIFFLPVIIASSVVMNLLNSSWINVPLFNFMSDVDSGTSGVIDVAAVLSQLRLPEVITNVFSVFISNVFNLIWSCGIQIVLFIAGLQTVIPVLYEAADVEGANAWEKFWYITFPMLGHVTLLVIIYTMIEKFIAVDNPVMKQAYAVLQEQMIYDKSSAMMWMYFAVVCAVMGIVLGLYRKLCLKRWE